jgi:thymidylate kinase
MKNNTKHIIFKNFIKYLYKKKIKYCVLTNGKNFPSQIIRDIDFYINFSNKSELINLVNIFCNKNSLKIINIFQHEVNSYFFCLSFVNLKNNIEFIQFDICNNYIINGQKIIKFDSENTFTNKKYKNYQYSVLKKDIEIAYILIKKINKLQLDEYQFKYIFKNKKIKEINILKRYFYPSTYKKIIKAINNKKIIFFKKNIIHLKKELFNSKYIKKISFVESCKLKIHRFFNPTGLFIVFLGCDGSGKSLIIRKTLNKFTFFYEKKFIGLFRSVKTFHWVPLKIFQNRKVDFKKPHFKREYSFLISFIKILYLFIIFLFGYFKNIFISRISSGLVINDRYFHDLLIDKKRYRIKSFQFLIKFFLEILPKPDLLIVLDAPANILSKRKDELTESQLSIMRLKYINLKKIIKDTIIVKNDGKINKTEQIIFKLIHDKMTLRIKKKYKT